VVFSKFLNVVFKIIYYIWDQFR